MIKKPIPPFFIVFIFAASIICLNLLEPPACQAAPVSAAIYLQNGTRAVLEISLANPVPTSLIAQIALPPSARVVATSPGGAKIEHGANLIKWLLKNPSAGSIQLSVTSAVAFDQNSLSGVVLFRRQQDGNLVKVKAEKR
jgi:hypothetical protein